MTHRTVCHDPSELIILGVICFRVSDSHLGIKNCLLRTGSTNGNQEPPTGSRDPPENKTTGPVRFYNHYNRARISSLFAALGLLDAKKQRLGATRIFCHEKDGAPRVWIGQKTCQDRAEKREHGKVRSNLHNTWSLAKNLKNQKNWKSLKSKRRPEFIAIMIYHLCVF